MYDGALFICSNNMSCNRDWIRTANRSEKIRDKAKNKENQV
jgi:hypothetical protein